MVRTSGKPQDWWNLGAAANLNIRVKFMFAMLREIILVNLVTRLGIRATLGEPPLWKQREPVRCRRDAPRHAKPYETLMTPCVTSFFRSVENLMRCSV